MRSPPSFGLRYLTLTAVISLLAFTMIHGQRGYHVTQYTSKEGLPQNSIKGLAFDQHGFLWMATEGGIARFDGRHFKVIGAEDHPLIRNQRFTQAIQCLDQSILFTDVLNGMYLLSNDQFRTIREPDAQHPTLLHIRGSLPDPYFVVRDYVFLRESSRAEASLLYVGIFPTATGKVFLAGDRMLLFDVSKWESSIVTSPRTAKDQFARLNQTILQFSANGQLSSLHEETAFFEPCTLTMENDPEWNGSLKNISLYSQFPFEDVFVSDGEKLYTLSQGENHLHFILYPLLDKIPENCKITSIAYQASEKILVIGTDSRGVFVYKPTPFKTFIPQGYKSIRNYGFYAQCLLDSNTLLTGNGLLVDLKQNKKKGYFENPIDDILLASDDQQNIYYTNGYNILRYNLVNREERRIRTSKTFSPHCIALIDEKVWIGTSIGVGQILQDSVHWIYHTFFNSEQHGIKSIKRDKEGNLWFASYFQLYRLDSHTQRIDSFPEVANVEIRVIEMIRDRPFIGTYGNGYFVFSNGRFVRMPDGRNHELSNTHTFIEDQDGYLWITTNRGLYKTHVDAIEAYLADTTVHLDYYTYLEEDGIYNAEFNGGCSPPHLWLPDGRLSLPSLEGLVSFDPIKTPHYFSRDSMVIEFIEVDGRRYRPEELNEIASNHTNITIHFAGAWWNNSYNQYVYLRLEESETPFSLCAIDQKALSIGHLQAGMHTLVVRRRCGFGPEDFIYSRIHFVVENPWYAKGWAIALFVATLILITWGIAVLNSRSIRRRNIELQKKVDHQTKALLASNVQLEENVQKLAESEIHLRKNLSVRDRLMSIITHDILTPLRFIGQIARLGVEEKPSGESLAKRALSDVENAVHKLFHSTQNLLHWVTYHQEQFKTSSINCSPFAIVEQLNEDFREMSRFQGNTLINNVPEDDIIMTDPRILNIILHNLISNAIKYTKDGEIRIRSAIKNQWYELEVNDTGRGMNAIQLEMIRNGSNNQFDVKQEDITAGTGIGLSLVADLIQIIHGRWEIESSEGSGVRVRVYIPLNQESES